MCDVLVFFFNSCFQTHMFKVPAVHCLHVETKLDGVREKAINVHLKTADEMNLSDHTAAEG